jgi:hypothetical protein
MFFLEKLTLLLFSNVMRCADGMDHLPAFCDRVLEFHFDLQFDRLLCVWLKWI